MKRIFILAAITVFTGTSLHAQITKKVCFLGNSYIYTNNMPGLVQSMATADGNTLIKDQNTPGGYTLEGHSTNTTSLAKISANTWDFVVLQDQSQLPSFPWSQVQSDVLPYAEILCDSIRSANACAIPLFFDTWGRQNGDPQWDSIDTFTEMNQRLYHAYEYMADANSGMLAPVGIAFEHIANDALPLVSFASLYTGDESHPTIFGSYLTACVFYELIYETSSVGNTYLPVGITNSQANYLQQVAHFVLNDVDSVQTAFLQPQADFSFAVNGDEVSFTNESIHAFSWEWNFGDGASSTQENPAHIYTANGVYNIQLIAFYCGLSDTLEYTVTVNSVGINQTDPALSFNVFPNPSENGQVTISNLETGTTLWIYSTDGRLINTLTATESEQVHLQLPGGMYLLKTKTSSQKLLVQ